MIGYGATDLERATIPMVKLIAAICMIIDHIGYVFFPEQIVWRLIGRLSMPLFAYSIARGYDHSKRKGTVQRYMKHLLIFTAVSQYPYFMMRRIGWNIGLTWVFSLLLLIVVDRWKESLPRVAIECLTILVAAYLLNVDYGVCGVLMPFALRPHRKYCNMFLATIVLWALYTLMNGVEGLIQVLSCAAVPLLHLVVPNDGKFRIHRRFYYMFYPAHILILIAIRQVL